MSGDLGASDIEGELSEADRSALEKLLSAQGSRLLAVADVMTGRRWHKATSRLPATLHLLAPRRFERYWEEYLGAGILRGSPSAPAEAAAFARWILCRIDSSSTDAQIVRFEACLNDVLDEVITRLGREEPFADSPLPDTCVLRVSPCVRIDSFPWNIDVTLRTFLQTGSIELPTERESTQLLFHPAPGRIPGAGATKLLPGMKLILNRAMRGIRMGALLEATPAAQREHVQAVIERLVLMRVLEAGAGGEHVVPR